MSKLSTTILLVLALASCNRHPESVGRPGEVEVTGNDAKAVETVDRMLTLTFVDGLLQHEHTFDVTMVTGGTGKKARHGRCVVMVEADSAKYSNTIIHYETDKWAKPQLVATITTPSASRLGTDMKALGGRLKQRLEAFELGQAIKTLRKAHQTEVEQRVKQMTGHTILIPKDMGATKEGRNFIWISNNTATGMRNICVYTFPGTDLSTDNLMDKRDSVMQTNIPGETPGMYMQTVRSYSPYTRTVRAGGLLRREIRGLWYMKDDAMGGPFISHAIADTAKKRTLVAEGFVFAPETKKRNIIKQLEAVLYTLK